MRNEIRPPTRTAIDSPARRKLLHVGVGLAAAWSAPAIVRAQTTAQGARYELDPDHLTVAFLVDHIGYAKTLGMFRAARGGYNFDEATGQLSALRIEVQTDSVFSNQRKRDDHLKGPDFLNSAQFPRMVFTADSAQRGTGANARNFEIKGQLQLLGKTQPLTLLATWNKSAESPLGGLGRKPYVMGVSARGSFKRSSFDMNYAVANGWVGDEVDLIIEFEAIRQ